MWPRNVSQDGPPESPFRPVMNAEDTANHILVDGNAESRGNLLGDAKTIPGIMPFQFNDGVDEFLMQSFRARRTPALARNNMRYFRLASNDRRQASRPCKPHDGDHQMKENDDDIAHPGAGPIQ